MGGSPQLLVLPPVALPTAGPGPLGTLAHLEVLLVGGDSMGRLGRARTPGVSGVDTQLSATHGMKRVGRHLLQYDPLV